MKVKSDNGSLLDCGDFDYAKYLGFIHQPITPAYPQANGLVESLNRMIGNALCTANVDTKIGSKNFINFWEIIEKLSILLQENLLQKWCYQTERLKIEFLFIDNIDFINNKDEVKDEDIRKKDAQEK